MVKKRQKVRIHGCETAMATEWWTARTRILLVRLQQTIRMATESPMPTKCIGLAIRTWLLQLRSAMIRGLTCQARCLPVSIRQMPPIPHMKPFPDRLSHGSSLTDSPPIGRRFRPTLSGSAHSSLAVPIRGSSSSFPLHRRTPPNGSSRGWCWSGRRMKDSPGHSNPLREATASASRLPRTTARIL